VNRDLRRAIDARDGVGVRSDLLTRVPVHVLDSALRAGHLVRLFPGTYANRLRASEPLVRAAAALAYAGTDAVLSHLTALGLWRLPGGDLAGPVHLSVPGRRRLSAAGGTGVVVHRRPDLSDADVVHRQGLPLTRLERSVVDSWSVLPVDARRAPVIGAVADRRTTPDRLRTALQRSRRVHDRAELVRLLNLLAAGCRSELELWGHDHVFTGPAMPAVERNVPVKVGGRTVYLDVYCRDARVNFELDGAQWHGSPRDRERDVRRDAALATMGIMVVRFTHHRLTSAPEEVRAEVRAIVARRLAA
jgi:hypothetical protein